MGFSVFKRWQGKNDSTISSPVTYCVGRVRIKHMHTSTGSVRGQSLSCCVDAPTLSPALDVSVTRKTAAYGLEIPKTKCDATVPCTSARLVKWRSQNIPKMPKKTEQGTNISALQEAAIFTQIRSIMGGKCSVTHLSNSHLMPARCAPLSEVTEVKSHPTRNRCDSYPSRLSRAAPIGAQHT